MITELKTVSGDPITVGFGTGTVVKHLKDPHDHTATSDEIVKLLTYAISIGYNHIDTAAVYYTQPEVGKAFYESGIEREKVFLSTKFSVFKDEEEKSTITATEFVEKTLKELRTDYIDLLLIHHPFFEPDHSESKYTLHSLWSEFIKIKQSGKVRYIGVSNFSISHLSSVIAVSKPFGREYFPVVNQIEFHACLQNQSPDIVSFCQINGILVHGYSPLTPLFRLQEGNVYLHRLLMDLETKYKKTRAQILLRYCLDKKIVPITTSCQETRLKECIDVYDFNLEEQDIKKIDKEGAKSPHQTYFAGKY
ncbi:aldose reductase [Spathaspora passalidarum NRRL Y-27907]|uniref:2-dehydropantolactone reductase n=1 Tax=Spathaspora passalidarum (strain NRRL Y-27907 / 11-Y1) TaxID=619300 RepID=G3AP93_SPAPN|nr:aldose reductase [Spathaspora passalidarum NRRL Y-27907]EGW32664.1 aldose reductase [Spathaspora passalidarum NRRL Y-27907]